MSGFDRLLSRIPGMEDDNGIGIGIGEESSRNALVYALARVSLAVIWIYQGLVPKILFRHPRELDMIRASGVFAGWEETVLLLVGGGEILFGVLLIVLWRDRLLPLASAVIPVILTLNVVLYAPHEFVRPFNPPTLVVGMVALGLIGYLLADDVTTGDDLPK
ncbi:MAG: DoxX-like family protein [Halobacteria archaeon]|nr:DoxX-like family protein [Halobacteria archaeon]